MLRENNILRYRCDGSRYFSSRTYVVNSIWNRVLQDIYGLNKSTRFYASPTYENTTRVIFTFHAGDKFHLNHRNKACNDN